MICKYDKFYHNGKYDGQHMCIDAFAPDGTHCNSFVKVKVIKDFTVDEFDDGGMLMSKRVMAIPDMIDILQRCADGDAGAAERAGAVLYAIGDRV